MVVEGCLEAHGMITSCVGMKYLTFKNASWALFQKTSHSDVEVSTIFSVGRTIVRTSLDSGCRGDSVATLWHTSVNRVAVISRTSLR